MPGERVVLEITEGTEGDRFWRADAVEVLTPPRSGSSAPCPVAGPGLCGGCDFQHVALVHQRELKAEVVREQLSRLAGLDLDVVVEAVPGDVDGLRWRTRQRYVELPDGRRGMRKHRSHDVVPVDDCLLEAPDPASHAVLGHEFSVGDDGFWQVHPGAPQALVETVVDFLAPRRGGVGARPVRRRGAVRPRSSPTPSVPAPASWPWRATAGRPSTRRSTSVTGARGRGRAGGRVLAAAYDEPFDLVVLDPPREGAKRTVVEQVVDRSPRAVAYVACDPAALARDVAIFAEHDYRLDRLRAFDLFPMTHHVECVALLEKNRL